MQYKVYWGPKKLCDKKQSSKVFQMFWLYIPFRKYIHTRDWEKSCNTDEVEKNLYQLLKRYSFSFVLTFHVYSFSFLLTFHVWNYDDSGFNNLMIQKPNPKIRNWTYPDFTKYFWHLKNTDNFWNQKCIILRNGK